MVLAMPFAHAQSTPPALPELTPQQSANVSARIDQYRRDTDARVASGEITADEAERLVAWREWQIAQQVAGAPLRVQTRRVPAYENVPPDYHEAQPPDYVVVEPAPYYAPYYRYPTPYYWGPTPDYWGPSVCAGGFGRHFGGRICF
jgi:hypothetical protein